MAVAAMILATLTQAPSERLPWPGDRNGDLIVDELDYPRTLLEYAYDQLRYCAEQDAEGGGDGVTLTVDVRGRASVEIFHATGGQIVLVISRAGQPTAAVADGLRMTFGANMRINLLTQEPWAGNGAD